MKEKGKEKGLLIVMASISPEKEEAFNKWYNEEHLPRVMERYPAVLSGRRYKIMIGSEHEQKYRYMAMYEFESYEALENAMKPDHPIRVQMHREYSEAFGEGGRYRILAKELKNLRVG